MGKFTKIPSDAFNALQLDAGVILKNFDPANPVEPADSDILCATTGGITISCVPTYSDLSEDVDNVPANMMEFMHLDSWECTVSTTSLGTSLELLRWALGSADVASASSKVAPRKDLLQTDFSDLWWVGDRADGGVVAVKIHNALSTGGMSLTTTKNGKGQIGITLTGHISINDQNTMPMEFYSIDPDSYSVVFNSNGGSAVDMQIVAAGGKATEPVDPTKSGYEFDAWYKEAQFINEWDFANDTVNAPTILYAKWLAEYTVSYNSNGGTAVASETVTAGEKATQPTPPTKQGYTFGGWYTSDALTTEWDFSTDTVNSNITLYAKWTE